MQDRYLKWVLGVERYTPGYMVREKLQRDLLRGRAGMRAWNFEKKLEEGKGGELARKCWEEMKGRIRRGKEGIGWEEERRRFIKERGWKMEEMVELRGEELIERKRRLQKEERWKRIWGSEYNRWYKWVKGEGVPGYLKKGWGESRWQRVARFRLGNGIRAGRYWEGEEGRKCRECERVLESWEHVWEECTDWRKEGGWQENVGMVLGEEGEGERWMRELEERRRERVNEWKKE